MLFAAQKDAPTSGILCHFINAETPGMSPASSGLTGGRRSQQAEDRAWCFELHCCKTSHALS